MFCVFFSLFRLCDCSFDAGAPSFATAFDGVVYFQYLSVCSYMYTLYAYVYVLKSYNCLFVFALMPTRVCVNVYVGRQISF